MIKFKVFPLSNYGLLSFVLGCCVALGQAPWALTTIAVVSLLILFYVISYQKIIRHEKIIFMFGVGYFSLTLHWIMEPFFVEGESYIWIAPFAFLALVFFCSSFWTFSTYLILKISRSKSTLTVALALIVGEVIRSYCFSGFPWGLIGYIWTDTPIALLSAWVGPIGLTGITFILTALPFSKINNIRPALSSLIIFLVLFSVTYFQLKTSDRLFSTKIVRLVQPNAVQEKKWDPLYSPIYFEVLLDLTSSGEKATVDLIIWPESAIVPFLDDATAEFKKIGENMPSDSELILGIRRQNKNNIYNSLVLLNNDGLVSGSYDKFHLVPFGEYIPILRYLEKLGLIFTENFSNIGFSPGNAVAVLSSKIGLFRPLICYEAIFFQEIYHESRPDFIVNITNDAWLGDWAGPSQHLQQVKMRAIEQGMPVIRSANTGISAIVNPYGETIASIGLGLRGYVDVLLPLKVKKTFYSLTGERVNFFIIFIWFCMIFFRRKKISIDDTYH